MNKYKASDHGEDITMIHKLIHVARICEVESQEKRIGHSLMTEETSSLNSPTDLTFDIDALAETVQREGEGRLKDERIQGF